MLREVQEQFKVGLRWQANAVLAMQEASEQYLVETFDLTKQAAFHARRQTIFPKDMKLVQTVRGSIQGQRNQGENY